MMIAPAAISVLCADDHTIVRTGLQMLLQLRLGIHSFQEASSCAELIAALRKQEPTHLIIDMVFKDGNSLELLPNIRSLHPQLPILVYSMLPEEIYAPALDRFGIYQYLHKGSSQERILESFRSFLFSPVPGKRTPRPEVTSPFGQLSARELEVLQYLLQGDSIGQISATLNVHKNTVSTLKSRIFEKTGAVNFKELLDMAAIYQLKS